MGLSEEELTFLRSTLERARDDIVSKDALIESLKNDVANREAGVESLAKIIRSLESERTVLRTALGEDYVFGKRTRAERSIAAERAKQRAQFDADHDDAHDDGMLAVVAGDLIASRDDPWGLTAKHDDRERLVVAAALLVAEIERLDRKAEREIRDRIDSVDETLDEIEEREAEAEAKRLFDDISSRVGLPLDPKEIAFRKEPIPKGWGEPPEGGLRVVYPDEDYLNDGGRDEGFGDAT